MPASSSRTRRPLRALRAASAAPDEPAPTTIISHEPTMRTSLYVLSRRCLPPRRGVVCILSEGDRSGNSERSPLSECNGGKALDDATATQTAGTVENFGIEIGNAMGWPRMAGRVLATLMLHDGPMSMKQ